MLKAFSKVFKSHDPPDESPAPRRVLERHRPAELGLGGAGQAARPADARTQSSPHRPGASNYPHQPLAMGAQATKEATRRTSLQYRMEQQQQVPRLHIKAPAPGPDGGFPLTAENLEWHLRLLPPMKESKYDRIIRYVRDQQMHVSATAAAAALDPTQHDIEQSMLMSGGPMHRDYVDPRYAPMEHAVAPAQAPVLPPGQLLVPVYAAAPAFVQQPLGGGVHTRMTVDRGYPAAPGPAYSPAGGAALKQVPPQANHATARPADSAAVAIRRTSDASANPRADNEEDDNTPLAAISWAAPALRPATTNGAIHGAASDGLYGLDDSLDGPLPSPVRLAAGDRMSMMSYPSNMAVNLASEANEINSRTLSTSLHEIASHATPAPHTPTALDAPAPLRGPDSAPLALKSDAATCAMPTANRGIDDDGGGGDGEGPQNSDQAAETESMGSVVALRIANRHTNGPTGGSSKSDDDDDNQPLVCLTRKPSERPGQETLRVCVATNAVGAEPPGSGGNVNNDDDDDRPLSALLLQSQTAGEDLGCLPLPPLVHDPDAPADLDDIVNESPTPLRTSIGSRLAAQGVARKSSLLSRAFHPELDEDGATAAPRRIRRPHRDRHSTPLSVPQSPGEAQMATEAPYNSLPRPPKARAIGNDASDGGNTSDGRYREAAAADGVEPAVLDRASGEAGRPWLRDQDYSVSDSSLSTNRRAKRGSALGQQLTEDLQRVRREIARERREADMSVRHSWQIGTLEAVPRPWMRDVHTLSDSALAKEAQVASQAAAATANNAVAHSDVPETQPAWPFASRARPMSTQNNHRLSRLYGWAAGGGRRSNSMPLGDDGEQMAAPVARSWLGRLKRTLRPGSTCIE